MKEEYLDLMIVKSNSLIESKNYFSLTQQRIISLALAQIPKGQEKFEWMNFPFNDLYPKGSKIGGTQYKAVKQAIRTMGSLSIFIQKESGEWHNIPFLQARGNDKTRLIEIKFVDDARDLLLNLSGNFTKYLLRSVSMFESSYSFRIYELCKQHLFKGQRECTMAFLRQRLGLLVAFEDKGYKDEEIEAMLSSGKVKTKYGLFNNFNKRILEVAQAEINKHSDIWITYEKVKRGKTIHAIKFFIKPNPNNEHEESTEPVLKQKARGITVDTTFEEVQSKSDYADQVIAEKGSMVKNTEAYKNKLMKDESFDKEYQEKQQEVEKEKRQKERSKQQKEQQVAMTEWENAYGEEYKKVRVPYCKMAGTNRDLIKSFRAWYQEKGSIIDKQKILDQIDKRELSSAAWLKFGTFMIEQQGSDYERKFFLRANPKPWIEFMIQEMAKEQQKEETVQGTFDFSGF
ncbi:replication initiation protein [Persicobacter psychrovividus]|uniref:Initiator Rep protein WH1 domain-containing protein n=1 Tax=Persicobacter psychrovividus TaxID=387638 RepID=A0ABM7VN93_9BACT|nr:hypothetical protein PEPS_47710 [Persicobacter psychrovividus]